jgi:hypothetical protein
MSMNSNAILPLKTLGNEVKSRKVLKINTLLEVEVMSKCVTSLQVKVLLFYFQVVTRYFYFVTIQHCN